MRTISPNSVASRIVAHLKTAGRPVSTREIADAFGLVSTVASAQLCQLRRLGRVEKETDAIGWGNAHRTSTWIPVKTNTRNAGL